MSIKVVPQIFLFYLSLLILELTEDGFFIAIFKIILI